jgi:molecular chaperone DnaK
MNRVGVDLGTTNTVAAMKDHVFAIGDEGQHHFASVVAFLPNGQICIGAAARRRRSIDGANTIFSSKRIIGRRFESPVTRTFCKRYPFEIVKSGSGEPAFRTRAGLSTPTDIAAILLDRVYERVQPLLEDMEVVITVPYGFKEPQRNATYLAARKAGFSDVRLLDEPSATAWAYHSDPDVDGVVAVYDLGGGTFDVSILDCGGSVPRFLAGSSDPFLGGDDIDHQIADWAAEEILKQHNWDLNNYSEVQGRLLAECERAKIRLSVADETQIDISEVDPECPLAGEGLTLRREIMDQLATRLVQRTFVTCDEALRKADVRPGDMRAVLLAGGSTNLPMVQTAVESYFGREGCREVDPIKVVARGASLASS